MKQELKEKLLLLADKYEVEEFIMDDPIQFPHRYTDKADIEISGLIASGSLPVIEGHYQKWWPDWSRAFPECSISIYIKWRMEEISGSNISFIAITHGMISIYSARLCMLPTGSMGIWNPYLCHSLSSGTPLERLQSVFGHINGMPALSSASEAKKMCMFLRWMIRRDSPVDLGIWRSFSPSDLIILLTLMYIASRLILDWPMHVNAWKQHVALLMRCGKYGRMIR